LNQWFGFFYFSVTLFTTVGFGDIYPVAWYAIAIACIQMLLGVAYTTAILARGVGKLTQEELPAFDHNHYDDGSSSNNDNNNNNNNNSTATSQIELLSYPNLAPPSYRTL